MKPLAIIAGFFWAGQRTALLRGWALSLTVLLAGAALLGLSGWFITAAAIAGIVGIGVDFDVFRPSAGVRFLALGRTAARYGERLLTHDATLRGLTELRVRLLRHRLALPFEALGRLRGALALNRLTADVDALDGLPLRLILPVTAALGAFVVAFLMLWWLVDLRVAAWIVLGFVLGAAGVLIPAARMADTPSRMAERAQQAMRARLIDLLRARTDLTVYGQLGVQEAAVLDADTRALAARATLDAIERRAGLIIQSTATLVAAGALAIGGMLALDGAIGPAPAALGFFAALALVEGLMPLRRAVAELGKMNDAARRVAPEIALPDQVVAHAAPAIDRAAPALELDHVRFARPGAQAPLFEGVSLAVQQGEIVALTGKSGTGKSTLLALASGTLTADAGAVRLSGAGIGDWPEAGLRAHLGLLPQRSALMSGTVFQALALGKADLTDGAAWAVLEAVALADVIEARGGLGLELGEGGSGLSGGESRRLALARLILRRPQVLLLDEVTEGLDDDTARAVLAGLRRWVPDAAILLASHRSAELGFADRQVALDAPL